MPRSDVRCCHIEFWEKIAERMHSLTARKFMIFVFVILIKSFMLRTNVSPNNGESAAQRALLRVKSAAPFCVRRVFAVETFVGAKKLNSNVSHTTRMTLMDFQLTFCFLLPSFPPLLPHMTEISGSFGWKHLSEFYTEKLRMFILKSEWSRKCAVVGMM